MSKKQKKKNNKKKKNKSNDLYDYDHKASPKDIKKIAFQVFGSTYFTISD